MRDILLFCATFTVTSPRNPLEVFMAQMEMVDLDSLLPSTLPYRQFQAYLPDGTKTLADVGHVKGASGAAL